MPARMEVQKLVGVCDRSEIDPRETRFMTHESCAVKRLHGEALLPGGGEYTFDFQWDDDLDPGELARTTENAADLFIEFTPGINWYADPCTELLRRMGCDCLRSASSTQPFRKRPPNPYLPALLTWSHSLHSKE